LGGYAWVDLSFFPQVAPAPEGESAQLLFEFETVKWLKAPKRFFQLSRRRASMMVAHTASARIKRQ